VVCSMTDKLIDAASARLADLVEQIDTATARLSDVLEQIRISELMLANSERLIGMQATGRKLDA
jgi:hypothetical protein